MKNFTIYTLLISTYLFGRATWTLGQVPGNEQLNQYVNPFIGTAKSGHTFPGAAVPFGLVQLSPETGYATWDYCSGYHYEDHTLRGFAHTHLNGTGGMDLGDVLVFPFQGEWKQVVYPGSFSKSSERASPGYYSVLLDQNHIKAELTASAHCGYHRYTFKGTGNRHLLIDLQSGLVNTESRLNEHVLESHISIQGHAISGYVRAKQWVDRKYFFTVRFSKRIRSYRYLDSAKRRIIVDLPDAGPVILQVALSTVSTRGAAANLQELKGKSFEQAKTAAGLVWNRYLSKIKLEGTHQQKVNFYTSLYHLLLQPNNIADLDGKYRGADGRVHQSADHVYYSTLSLWDTYRAAHPLYTLLYPEKDGQIVGSILSHFKTTGTLPVWTLWGKENWCMIGNHSVPVIVDAYLKGIKGIDGEKAWQAIEQTLTKKGNPKYNWPMLMRHGFIPSDSVKDEAVSRSLEAAYDDWCAAQLAKALHKDKAYRYFSERAQFYRNLFDPVTHLMRGRYGDGSWRSPFDPLTITHEGTGGDYTEGNAWQYTWSVQHDIPGLVKLMGGEVAFGKKLDSLFFVFPSKVYGSGTTVDVTGLIGQYAHGNEPSHHIAYLYNYAGKPWQTQELIPRILKEQYQATPDGLSGNDDCGQMSAWYIFSSLGFYPVNPANGKFDIGVPSFKSASIIIHGKLLKIIAPELSSNNRYVKSVKLNGKIVKDWQVAYNDLIKGGILEFTMTNNHL